MSDAGHTIAAVLFHDRAPLAWLIVASYFVGAAAAFWASRSARKRDRRFWIGTALLLVFLGLNKELDLQTLLTVEGRSFAHYAGWYEQRRVVQGIFLLVMAVVGVVAIAALVRWLRKSPGQVKTAAVGIVLLFTFVLIRAGSFHHIDDWVTINVAGMRTGWWLELAGTALIGLSALAYRIRRKQR
ncbi:MAG TPA: hypothetical protein VFH89_15355 [Sphingomicrobium sp.]|nr:hypothetical protein [Sphingomicrobium sp.]